MDLKEIIDNRRAINYFDPDKSVSDGLYGFIRTKALSIISMTRVS